MTDATETLSIDAFITARLDEDEGIAREAADVDAEGPSWRIRKVQHNGMYVFGEGQIAPPGGKLGMSEDAQTIHVARHDPARVLREVAWKRHLLGFALAAFSQESKIGERPGRDPETNAYDKGRADTARFMLRLLAMSWSSHPDFRAEWSA